MVGCRLCCSSKYNSFKVQYMLLIFSPFVLKHHVSFLSPFVFFYHPFCLLICCPSSFDLYVFNSTGKDQKLTTDFQKNFTFSQAWAFDLVLPLGVTTPLITPVMGISWPCSFWEIMFWYVEEHRIWRDFLQVQDNLIGSILVDLCEVRLGGSLGSKLWDKR